MGVGQASFSSIPSKGVSPGDSGKLALLEAKNNALKAQLQLLKNSTILA